jgi:hypothetical protein
MHSNTIYYKYGVGLHGDLRQAGADDCPETRDSGSATRRQGAEPGRHCQKRATKNCPAIVLDGSGESPYTAPVFMLYHDGMYQIEIQAVPK